MKKIDWVRILGGNPFAVAFRLILTSIVVGIILDTLGINFRNFFYRMHDMLHLLYNYGLDTFQWLLDYFLLGALIVIPIWVLARLGKGSHFRN